MSEPTTPIKTETEVLLKEPLKIILETKDKAKKKGVTPTVLDFLKWIIGTLVLGAVGLWISYRHNTTEDNLAKYNADVKLVTSINFDSSSLSQLNSLTSIQPFLITESIKNIVIERIVRLTNSLSMQAHANAINNIQIKTKKSEKNITMGQETELIKADSILKSNSGRKQVNISQLKAKEASIVGNATPVDSTALEILNSNQKNFTPSIVDHKEDTYYLVNSPVTQWCKQGYYVEYNSTLRIGLNNLDNSNQSITVNCKDIETDKDNPPVIIDNKTILVGQTDTLKFNKYRYQITLNYIGAAGRNPFTKAAYITVATYKKQ